MIIYNGTLSIQYSMECGQNNQVLMWPTDAKESIHPVCDITRTK